MSLTAAQNTSLSSSQEREFKKWARAAGRIDELESYDLRGHWLHARHESKQLVRFYKTNHTGLGKKTKKKKPPPKDTSFDSGKKGISLFKPTKTLGTETSDT